MKNPHKIKRRRIVYTIEDKVNPKRRVFYTVEDKNNIRIHHTLKTLQQAHRKAQQLIKEGNKPIIHQSFTLP